MPEEHLKHLNVLQGAIAERFTPVTGFEPDTDRPAVTARQLRYLHAAKLTSEIELAKATRETLLQASPITTNEGMCLEVEGDLLKDLDITKLEDRASPTKPVEVLNVKTNKDGIVTAATVYLPPGRFDVLGRKIAKYADTERDPDGSKGLTLALDTIEIIRLTNIADLWVGNTPLPTDENKIYRFELWARKGTLTGLRSYEEVFGIKLSSHTLSFQKTDICLITCNLRSLALVQIAYANIVEFRYSESSPAFFDGLPAIDQAEWLNDLISRTLPAPEGAPGVCVLDTGVRRQHPLLETSLRTEHCDSYDAQWGTDDNRGHGTKMAGLALYGDLAPLLESQENVILRHTLASVKILPNVGQNADELFGWITIECAARATINSPTTKYIYCLAISSDPVKDGRPTAWSSAIDRSAFGSSITNEINDDDKKLFVLSVGNIADCAPGDYPARNDLEHIENPSQAWNGLSVGAMTSKGFSDSSEFDGWELVAPVGALSATGRTTVNWLNKEWPIKPDLVCEGGNHITDQSIVTHDASLSPLTTGRDHPIDFICQTSAATADVARMAANIQAEYPDYWPETVRGLLVHSAEWTREMIGSRALTSMNSSQKEVLLRRYGYGVPRLDVAMASTKSSACMIFQDSIQPFEGGLGEGTFGYINYHDLPWPVDFLQQYGNEPITLKVTLSYFIEPNPTEGIVSSENYASYGLRFSLQRPTEADFHRRINRRLRQVGETFTPTGNDNWLLKQTTRNKGSLISDVWKGTAADLAQQAQIAVHPINGWWKYRKYLERTNSSVRYSLIITVQFQNPDIDVYSEIKTIIDIQNTISVLT